jgi:hypothetical protein
VEKVSIKKSSEDPFETSIGSICNKILPNKKRKKRKKRKKVDPIRRDLAGERRGVAAPSDHGGVRAAKWHAAGLPATGNDADGPSVSLRSLPSSSAPPPTEINDQEDRCTFANASIQSSLYCRLAVQWKNNR